MSFFYRLVFCFFLLNATVYVHAEDGSTRTVLIGFAGPLSEPGVLSAKNAALLAVEEANKSTIRINGQAVTFKLIAENDRADQRTAAFIAHYFANTHVVGVVGHLSSDAALAASPIYAEAEIPEIAPIAWLKKYTQQNFRTSFQMVGDDALALRNTADYLINDVKMKNFLVIDDGAQLGSSMADHFVDAVKSSNGNIIERISVSNKTSDFNVPLQEAIQKKPELIFFSGRVIQSKALLNEMIWQHRAVDVLITGIPLTDSFFENIKGMDNRLLAIVVGAPFEKMSGVKSLKKKYYAKFGNEMLPFSAFSYDSVNVLIAAIKKADSLEQNKIVDALHAIEYDGVTGKISFNENGALSQPVSTLYELKNRRWEVVKIFKNKN